MLRGEPIWHTSSTGPMSMPSSSEAVATSARRSPARSRVSTRWRRSFDRLPWWAATTSSPRRSPELVGEPLRQPAGVHEHERGAVLGDELGDAVDDVAHLLGRGDRLELALGQLEREVELALVAGVDDCRAAGRVADEQPGHRLDRALRGGQADTRGAPLAERLEPLEREGEVRAALVAGEGVDLVDDHRLDRARALAARSRW